MNNITVAGMLGKDAELRYLPNGDPVVGFSVADSQGKEKPTIWWSCQLFGKRAQSLAEHLTKGQHVTVSGSVSEREWTDKNGNQRKTMDVRVSEIALQGGRRDSQGIQPHPASAKAATAPARDSFDSDSDCPF